MKHKRFTRFLSCVLCVAMAVALLPMSAIAAQVTTTPGNTSLDVEYFTSTLYNWDEDAANAATKAADATATVKQDQYTPVSDLENGEYLIVSKSGYLLTNNSNTSNKWTATGLSLSSSVSTSAFTDSSSNYAGYRFTVKATDGGYYVMSGENYLTIGGNNNLTLSATPAVSAITSYSGTFAITQTVDGVKYCLNNFGGENTFASGYNEDPSGSNDQWYLMKYSQVDVATGEQAGKGFYFTAKDVKNRPDSAYVPAFSSWMNATQNYFIYSGLAEQTLSDATNAPFDNDNVNAANLFASSSNDYTDVYTNVKVPFYIDSDGYYNLNSDTNAVYFEGGSGASNATMKIANKPACFYQDVSRTQSISGKYGTGFAPFNALSTSTTSAALGLVSSNATTTTTDSYKLSDDMVYGFGMVTSVPFQMTDDGKDANGEDVTFEFSGDDDVWVYIDGQLVLDIGGTHDAIKGTINFATGDVTLSSPYWGKIGDKSVSTTTTADTLSQKNIYTVLGTTLTGFASQGSHTMTIYYMDRGQGSTNCLIRFNLPQKDSVSVTKQISSNYSDKTEISSTVMKTLSNVEFSYTLKNSDKAVANAAYTLTQNGTIVGSGMTDAKGQFTLKNGQTATFKNISLDTETSYQVIENLDEESNWVASWTATSSVSNAAISGKNGATSDTVTVKGSATASDSISFVCTNTYVKNSTKPIIDANDETIVLDYGLPTTVDVLANDVVESADTGSVKVALGEIDSDIYTVTVNDKNEIVVTPVNEMESVIEIPYTVSATYTDTVTGDQNPNSDTAYLTVVPATSVYYEDSYTGMITYTNGTSAVWKSVGTAQGFQQETGLVGTTTDSTYGSDVGYKTAGTGDSYGTSMMVDTTSGAASFTYTFTGTGTAIYSRISTDSAYIRVKLTNVGSGSTDYNDLQYIDTRVIGDVAGASTMYNIPVYMIDNITYGTYKVEVTVAKAGTKTSAGGSGAEFYLDGIRVYEPVEDDAKDAASVTAYSAYAADNEANIAMLNIREKIISDAAETVEEGLSKNAFVTLTDTSNNIVSLDDYAKYTAIGPNNEFYLNGTTYNLAFDMLNWDSQSYKLYLGMKAPGTSEATVTIGGKSITVPNGTDCYYDISDYVVVKTVTVEDETVTYGQVSITGESGLLALTNIKVVGGKSYNVASTDIGVGGSEGSDNGGDTASLLSLDDDTLYFVSTSYMAVLCDAEEEATPVFTPDTFDAGVYYSRFLKMAIVSVEVSDDVSYITVDGVKCTPRTFFGTNLCTYTARHAASGTTYEIVAYNADGIASEPISVVAK